MPQTKVKTQQQTKRQQYGKIPNRTTKDDPDRYTKNPHEYGDILITGRKLGTALQRDILYWIERYTWGTNIGKKKGEIVRPEFAKLSLTALGRLCGGAERKNVAVALSYLTKHKIIEARDRTGCGPTVAKMYKLTPEHWRAAPAYEPPSPAEIEQAEAEAESTEVDPASIEQPQLETTVASGRLSRPQPLQLRTAKDTDPITIRIVYRPVDFGFAVSFRAHTGRNGRIQVTARPETHSERKANDCSRPDLQLKNYSDDNKRFTEFEFVTDAILRETWGKTSDPNFITRIMSAAGKAPAELFGRLARAKLKRNRSSEKYTSGILLLIASDAARAHAKNTAVEASERARTTPQGSDTPMTAEERANALKAATDENCQPCDGTGQRGYWERGTFRQLKGSLGGKCPICAGTGRPAR